MGTADRRGPDRRTVLGAMGAAAALWATGGLVAACGGSRLGGVAAGGGTVANGGPWWMAGNFAPVHEEVELFDLAVTGNLPPGLDGLYVRNGSNPSSGPSPHWFLGDGMLHGVRLSDSGASWYRNRWVHTPMFEQGVAFDEAGPPGGAANQSNVSVISHGGRLLSLGEVGHPYEIDTSDLSTVGPWDFDGRLNTAMTAHPKIDPATGRMHFFGYGFVPPYLTYHVAEADGTLVRSEEIEVAGPTMIHDFAITDREAIFWELPVVFDMEAAVGGDDLPFRWDPDYGARIGVLGFDEPGSAIRWVEIEPCYVFHGVNAARHGDEIVLDVCRQASMFDGGADNLEPSSLWRWRIDTAGDMSWSQTQLDDGGRDLPSIDRRHMGLPSRHAWFAETAYGEDLDLIGIGHHDAETGRIERWEPDATGVGEAFFVPGGDAEGEGWLLAFAHDKATDRSTLVVLDASDVTAGPVATVWLPVRVPYGFHGLWIPEEDLA